jgi:hypothetical protein
MSPQHETNLANLLAPRKRDAKSIKKEQQKIISLAELRVQVLFDEEHPRDY